MCLCPRCSLTLSSGCAHLSPCRTCMWLVTASRCACCPANRPVLSNAARTGKQQLSPQYPCWTAHCTWVCPGCCSPHSAGGHSLQVLVVDTGLTRHSHAASAGNLQDAKRLQQVRERLHLVLLAQQLNSHGAGTHVQDIGAEDGGEVPQLTTLAAGAADLDQHELPVDKGQVREVVYILHKHQLVQLLEQLIYGLRSAGHHHADARHALALAGAHSKALHVVATACKHTSHLVEHTGHVLHLDAERVCLKLSWVLAVSRVQDVLHLPHARWLLVLHHVHVSGVTAGGGEGQVVGLPNRG
mmetsp:Transcript_22816/g.49998  ORF Transcript_22816/g.49998 Transcript_22816/m.49998 type:complete len:299 (-) Transcript_22816:800-1696(-)